MNNVLLTSFFPPSSRFVDDVGRKKRKSNHENDVAQSGPALDTKKYTCIGIWKWNMKRDGEEVQTGATYILFGEEQGNIISEE